MALMLFTTVYHLQSETKIPRKKKDLLDVLRVFFEWSADSKVALVRPFCTLRYGTHLKQQFQPGFAQSPFQHSAHHHFQLLELDLILQMK